MKKIIYYVGLDVHKNSIAVKDQRPARHGPKGLLLRQGFKTYCTIHGPTPSRFTARPSKKCAPFPFSVAPVIDVCCSSDVIIGSIGPVSV